MIKKQKQNGLGKALQNKLERKKFKGYGVDHAPIFYQETEENQDEKKKQKIQSVLEQNNLAEYLHVAELSQQDFHANRDIKFSEIRDEIKNKKIILLGQNKKPRNEAELGHLLKGLQVPRRPHW